MVPLEQNFRYFGWSDDRVIETSDFAGFSFSQTEDGVLPDRAANGYIVFAVLESEGWPSRLFIGDGRRDVLRAFRRQAGTVDDSHGVAHIVGVTTRLQAPAVAGGPIRIEH